MSMEGAGTTGDDGDNDALTIMHYVQVTVNVEDYCS